MRKLTPILMMAALGVAMAMSTGAPYDLAAHNLAINHSPAAEILKVDASYAAMRAAQDHPDLPPGMVIVWPSLRSDA